MRVQGGRVVAQGWLWLCLLGAGCDRGAVAEPSVTLAQRATTESQSTEQRAASSPPAEVDHEGLLIGEFRLAANPVVDGDTVRVEGIDGSIRLLCLDTEEKIRSNADRTAIRRDFDRYLEQKRGGSARPKKAATPMGDAASAFAREFFEGVETVRLERDDPEEIRGRYGRLLAYVFAKKNGRWTSYNVECVRAGMSPYFTKYGYSRRFHNEFALAEAEAREAKRGIWNPASQGYGDYDERKAWWNARADFIRAFEHEANRRDDYVELGHFDAEQALEAKLGQEVTVLGTVDRIRKFSSLVRVSLVGHRTANVPLIFRDHAIFRESDVARYQGEPITARGLVERYEKGDYRTLQIEVHQPSQISLPTLPWPSEETKSIDVR
ncbi:MAG: thermonuclease family protein [Myxococcales bacterium]